MGKKKPIKTFDVEHAPIRDRKLGQKDKRKVDDDNENKKDLQKEKSFDGKAADKRKGSLEDATARISKKHKTGAEKVLPMKNGTDIKKDLKKQSSDGKLRNKGKRNLEDGTTNVLKKRKSDKIVNNDLMEAKESFLPKEVETSSCDEDSSDSMAKPKIDASSSEATEPNTSFAAKQNSIIVGNLAPSMDKDELQKFLEVAGTIVGIHLPIFKDGTCIGSAQVEFSTPQSVNKACYLDGKILKGRAVSINFGHERLPFSPDSCLFETPDNFNSNTVLIKGFDAAYGEMQINRSLRNRFSSCGRITKTEIPINNETGGTEGAIFMEFRDRLSMSNALKLNGTDIGGGLTLSVEEVEPGATGPTLSVEEAEPGATGLTLSVEEAEPRANNSFGGGRGGNRGGRGRGGTRGGKGRGGTRGGKGRGGRGRGGSPGGKGHGGSRGGKGRGGRRGGGGRGGRRGGGRRYS